MATNGGTTAVDGTNGVGTHDHADAGVKQHRFGNPLGHTATNDSTLQYQAFGGEFQPGLYRGPSRKFANPAPLGLSAFALTTFVLSLINMQAQGITEPSIVIALAFGYGGFVQFAAGMWEMAVGNTFGATALSSYGGFWFSFAIILTPGGFQIVSTLGPQFFTSMGFYLIGWWIFTTVLLLCTLRSTLMFFLLFFWLDLAFLMLGLGYLLNGPEGPNLKLVKAGGFFGLLAAFWAWYNALAGIMDSTNSFFVVPVLHFPWSEKGRERRGKEASHIA